MCTKNLRHVRFYPYSITIIVSTILYLTILLFTFQKVGYDHVFAASTNQTFDDFGIAAAGDWGCHDETEKTVTNILKNKPKLVLGLGDYSYEVDASCWLQMIKPFSERMKIAIGNHDHSYYTFGNESFPVQSLLTSYMNHFNLTKQYYSFDYQNIHFLAISTEIPYDSSSEQYRFIVNDLKKANNDPKIDWIIPFYHRVAYTSPADHGSIAEIRDTFHPVFEKYDVDLVLQAHSHNYQRSYPIIYNSEKSSTPIVADYNKTEYYKPKGQIFLIVGTGGANVRHNFTGLPAYYMTNQFNAYGYLNIDVVDNGTKLVGSFHNNNGSVNDAFIINKSVMESKIAFHVPKINDKNQKLKIETVFSGLQAPTSLEFLAIDDILVTEKDNGKVRRIINGNMLEEPLLDVNVANKVERGLLGIEITKTRQNITYVFLYYTESKKDGEDVCQTEIYCDPKTDPIGNRLYRYELANNKLINPKLLLNLPTVPTPGHNGGVIKIGPDNNLYLVIGNVNTIENEEFLTKAENFQVGLNPDGRSGILRITQDGQVVNNGIIGDSDPLNKYYAYGIRNSFGIDFDPLTGHLWDTENGPDFGDEINLVERGFNSGWNMVQGIWERRDGSAGEVVLNPEDTLIDFDGKGNYSNPEFTWFDPVGVTAIKFFNSTKMGPEYKDDLFVGDFNNGNIYHFDLNVVRTSLVLNGSLADKVAESFKQLEDVKFAGGFAGITDLEVGPDGYLYILSHFDGTIYRIIPSFSK